MRYRFPRISRKNLTRKTRNLFSQNINKNLTEFLQWIFFFLRGSLMEVSTCPICKKTFEKVQSLYGHLQIHGLSKSNHELLNCEKCNTRFDTLSELWRHQRVHEDLHRPFPCQICDKTFERYPFFIPLNLMNHLLLPRSVGGVSSEPNEDRLSVRP